LADLDDRFAEAASQVKQLPGKPDNADLLRLYALYKQASGGDVTGERPGVMDFVGRAKYHAWEDLHGISQEDAMQSYVDLVKSLQG